MKPEHKTYDLDKWWIFSILFWARLSVVILLGLMLYLNEAI